MATRSGSLDTRIGQSGVGTRSVVVLTNLFSGLAVLLVYSAMAFWPPPLPPVLSPGAPAPDTTASFLGATVVLPREHNLLLIVAILGSLGAMAQVLRSFAMYVGQRQLRWSWVVSYVTTPFIGATLAVIAYILLRAGLIGATGSQEGNTWGFAAVATLVGLFNAQAASKLKDIFEVILTPSGDRRDALSRAAEGEAESDENEREEAPPEDEAGEESGEEEHSLGDRDGADRPVTPIGTGSGTGGTSNTTESDRSGEEPPAA